MRTIMKRYRKVIGWVVAFAIILTGYAMMIATLLSFLPSYTQWPIFLAGLLASLFVLLSRGAADLEKIAATTPEMHSHSN